jgi:hypothetical protein
MNAIATSTHITENSTVAAFSDDELDKMFPAPTEPSQKAAVTKHVLMEQLNEPVFGVLSEKLVENGWSVFPQERDGKRMPGKSDGKVIAWKEEHDLQNRLPVPRALKRWNGQCTTHNVAVVFGPASGNTFAIDIDIQDEDLSAAVEALAVEMLGETPFRRQGQAPKMALIYRVSTGEKVKSAQTRLKKPEGADEIDAPLLEILGHGKPLTIYGRHHKTGGRFVWFAHQPIFFSSSEATLVTPAMVESFLEEAVIRFGIGDAELKAGVGGSGYSARRVEVDTDDDESTGLTAVTPRHQADKWSVDLDGRVDDGRNSYLNTLVFQTVRTNRFEVEGALFSGRRPMLTTSLVQTIAAVWKRTAVCEGRWSGESLELEIERSVDGLLTKVESGEIVFRDSSVNHRAEVAKLDAGAKAAAAAIQRPSGFRNLGRAKDAKSGLRYHFLTASGDLVSFTAQQLLQQHALVQLETIAYWSSRYPSEKGGAAWSTAGSDLIVAAQKLPLWNPDRVRGRGVWWNDDSGAVFHAGDAVYVGRQRTSLNQAPGHHVYDHLPPLASGLDFDAPLTADEGRSIVELCQSLAWRENKTGTGALFAGWIAAATVCGGLSWRTHGWLSAKKGDGKTWILDNILMPLLGAQALAVQGQTSEAAIRRVLSIDARPVLFEEAETQTQADAKRIQAVLNLARAASSEHGPEMLKASSEGDGVNAFRVRSMFMFQSINSGLQQAADESRSIRFELAQPANKQQREAGYRESASLLAEAMVNGVEGKLLARMLTMLPAMRQACGLFHRALVRAGADSRTGDTYGTVVAGSWILMNDELPTDEQADAYVKRLDVSVTAVANETLPDWQRALDVLAQHKLEVEGATEDGAHLRGRHDILNLCLYLAFKEVSECRHAPELTETNVRQALGAAGIRVEDVGDMARITVASSSSELNRVYERTP